jgi:hypothetical protein
MGLPLALRLLLRTLPQSLNGCLPAGFASVPPLLFTSSRVGINIAQTIANNESSSDLGRGKMKELANSLAQLAAIIMILITLAISTAAVSQWASAGETRGTDSAGGGRAQTLLVSDAR